MDIEREKEEILFIDSVIERSLRNQCKIKGLDPDKWDVYTLSLTEIAPLVTRKLELLQRIRH
jgi:hypothetical protein